MTTRSRTAAAGWKVRLRLVAVSTAALAGILLLAAGFLVWRVQSGLQSEIDAAVRQQALSAAASVADDPSSVAFLSSSVSGVGQVVDATGAVVAASGQIEGEGSLFDFAVAPVGAVPPLRTMRLGPIDDTEFRVAVVRVPGNPDLRLYFGLPMAEIGRSTTALATSLALGLPVVLALLALLTWWFAGRALRPVDELLERLDTSLRRQRGFVADAAHELRSPVAAIRAQLEAPSGVLRDAGVRDPEPDGPGAAVRHEVARLSTLVDDLLALACLDAEPGLNLRPVDLDDIAYAEARSLRERSDLTVDVRGVRAARLEADRSLLVRVVRNLVDNAEQHAASRVCLELAVEDDEVRLSVADDGPGIPGERRGEVFERFTRLDAARARDSGGVGLGLAIVADVVTAHHGRVEILDNLPGARVVVRLPASQGR